MHVVIHIVIEGCAGQGHVHQVMIVIVLHVVIVEVFTAIQVV